jgi:hypothetical protein
MSAARTKKDRFDAAPNCGYVAHLSAQHQNKTSLTVISVEAPESYVSMRERLRAEGKRLEALLADAKVRNDRAKECTRVAAEAIDDLIKLCGRRDLIERAAKDKVQAMAMADRLEASPPRTIMNFSLT